MIYTFANYLEEELSRIDDAATVEPLFIKLELDNCYEGYCGFCKRNNLDRENLDYEFTAHVGRNPEID